MGNGWGWDSDFRREWFVWRGGRSCLDGCAGRGWSKRVTVGPTKKPGLERLGGRNRLRGWENIQIMRLPMVGPLRFGPTTGLVAKPLWGLGVPSDRGDGRRFGATGVQVGQRWSKRVKVRWFWGWAQSFFDRMDGIYRIWEWTGWTLWTPGTRRAVRPGRTWSKRVAVEAEVGPR